MDLHYLTIFYEVAKEKSFTRAAEKLYINQSAVSIQIKKFEEQLGTKLIDRSTKKLKLTYAGEELFKMAEEIIEKINRSEKEIVKIIESNRSKIAIGASPVIAEPLLPGFLKKFSIIHDEIEYSITVSNKQHLLKLLRDGELDVLVIDEEYINDKNLEIIDIQRVPYVLISEKNYKSVKDVAKDPLISRNNVFNNQKAIATLENKYKIHFDTLIYVEGNLGITKSMVKEKIANIILPYYSVHKEVENGEFYIIEEIKEVQDSYQVVVTKDKLNSEQVKKFLDLIIDYKIINY